MRHAWLLGIVFLGCSSSSSSGTGTPAATAPDAAPTSAAYPAGPYGVEVGDTIANLSFAGWSAPPYAAPGGTLSLADFYGPKWKLVVVNVCSVWCGPCKAAYAAFKEKAADYGAKGVAMVTILYENSDAKPISLDEGAKYGTDNGIAIPLGIDPGYQLSNGVRPAEVPAYIVLSAHDMRVLGTTKSADDAPPWAFVDQKLSEIQ